MKKYLSIFLIFISCKDKFPNGTPYFLAAKSDNYASSKFYKDFDIFNRQGIGQLVDDTLKFPFFRVRDLNDSTIELTQFTAERKIDFKIPKDDRITYEFYDIGDGPKHVYTKIFKDRVVSYGYDHTLDEVMNGYDSVNFYDLIPSEITIMGADTVNSYFFGNCLDLPGININELKVTKKDFEKYWIKPFTAPIRMGCKDKVSYFDKTGTQKQYFEESTGKRSNPITVGQKEFQYWRDYYGYTY